MKLNQTNPVQMNYVNNVNQSNHKTQTNSVSNEPSKTIVQNNTVEIETETSKDESEQLLQDIQEKAVDQANKSLKQYDRVIERAVHPVTHTLMYTVRDEKTNEIIAEFPPKKIQDMIAKMWEMAGLVVDAKV